MRAIVNGRRGLAAAVCVSVVALLTGCANTPGQPAPVYQRGSGPTASTPAAPPPWRENAIVTVRHGETLGDIARTYRVPERAIIAANQLKPPYELRTGARLVIPDRNAPPPRGPVAASAAPPTHPPASMPAQTIAATPAPPPNAAAPRPLAPSPQMAAAPAAVPLTPPRPAAPTPQIVAATAPAQPPVTPPSAAKMLPDIVPLDAPPKQAVAAPGKPEPAAAPAATPAATASGAPPVLPARNPAAALPLPGEAAPPVAAAEPAAASGRFPWPVSGKVLANYGSGAGASRNEGINIAAPRGTAVRAIDGGTVAYVGNEVPGYGNLVLVKHPNGWISAYAHLDDTRVKKGDTVGAGEIIAKVGSSGGVGEPQLHFELRRGKRAVDPREFLAPAPSAAVRAGQAG